LGGRRIIGDIGGTNARFAIAEGGKYRELMHVEVARFGSLHDALTDYLNGSPASPWQNGWCEIGDGRGDLPC